MMFMYDLSIKAYYHIPLDADKTAASNGEGYEDKNTKRIRQVPAQTHGKFCLCFFFHFVSTV